MKKFLSSLIAIGISISLAPISQAQAAIVKTTITISAPAHIFAGNVNPVDVGICPKTSLNAKSCTSGKERQVTLWANGAKVQTLTTVGGGGAVSFNWKPKSTGKIKLKVTVAAASAQLRSVTSEIKTVTVKAKATPTSIGTMSCGTVCVSGIPKKIQLQNNGVITAGIVSGVTKARKVRFQTLRVSNKYVDQSSASSTWQSDIGRYGMSLAFDSLDPNNECTPGQTMSWNFRFYVDATSKSPAAATAAKWIDIVCPAGSGNTGDISLDVIYSDFVIDYTLDSPPSAFVDVTAPSTSQYSIYSEYCYKDDDCSDYDNWYWMTTYLESDKVFGNQEFEMSMDPGDYGDYWVRVHVVPWTGEEELFSEWYSLSLR